MLKDSIESRTQHEIVERILRFPPSQANLVLSQTVKVSLMITVNEISTVIISIIGSKFYLKNRTKILKKSIIYILSVFVP